MYSADTNINNGGLILSIASV